MKDFSVLLFYKYVSVSDPRQFADEHLQWCAEHGIKGRVYVAGEGINGTVSGQVADIEQYKLKLKSYPQFGDIVFKEDRTEGHAFLKMHVRVRNEIVNSSLEDVSPNNGGKRLTPEMLLEFYETGKDFIIVDARNGYESMIGRFKSAITPQMKNFRDWPKAVEELKEHKQKTVVTYCTGGIRCEKASAYLVEQGFEDVYQLEGGIVSFAKKFPDTYWEGGIFVFDERRVVEPNSRPDLKSGSKCFFCGKPTSYYINCHNTDCDKIIVTCHECKIENEYCCSDECRKSENKRDRYYG